MRTRKGERRSTGPCCVDRRSIDMSSTVLQINYKLNGSREEYESENLPYAQPIAAVHGLRWKVWIINEDRGEAGGIYLFDSKAAAQAFVDGPMVAEMKG